MIVLSQYVTNAVSCIELPSTLLSVSPLLCFCCPGTTYHHPGTKLTLPELLSFNIPAKVGTKYSKFGTFLLDDGDGSRVKAIAHKHHKDAEEINTEILQEWLTGMGKQPVTWATLLEVLRHIDLKKLAGEIKAVKCLVGESISVINLYCSCITKLRIQFSLIPRLL